MTFRYINPGLKDLFDEVSIDARQGYDAGLRCSRTSGDFFYFANGGKNVLHLEQGTEYWCSFCWFLSNSSYNDTFYILLIDNSSYGIALRRRVTNNRESFLGFYDLSGKIIGEELKQIFVVGQALNIEIYVKDDPVSGSIHLWINGVQVYDFSGNTGRGEGFNKFELRGYNTNYIDYYSDVVVQNTGRIGDMRVNRIPVKEGSITSEWDKCTLPMGVIPKTTNDYISSARTIILTQCKFDLPGKISAAYVATAYDPTLLTFFLFRKNNVTGKYNSVEIRKDCRIEKSSVARVTFVSPMLVESGDILGVYLSYGRVYDILIDSNFNRTVITDITQSSEVDMPTESYKYTPCICTLFSPNDASQGVIMINTLQKENPRLAEFGDFETNNAEKSIFYSPDMDNLKIGKIDALSISAMANYEGESAAKSICSILKSGDACYEETPWALSTAERKYFSVIDRNPLTDAPWMPEDVSSLKFGIRSKA